jgi:tRNA(Ile)-lysidine synthase
MIKLSFKLPRKVGVAVSGGCDSMAVLDFLRRSHEVTALHFNHGTEGSEEAMGIVHDFCKEKGIDLLCQYIDKDCPKGASLEDFWRQERYKFFETFYDCMEVVTCHHLDDAVETWIFTSLNGEPRLIPQKRGMFLRPFLQTRKAVFEDWCSRKDVPYLEDQSNLDIRFKRNYIRHMLMPKALMVNPGLHKVIRKKYQNLENRLV